MPNQIRTGRLISAIVENRYVLRLNRGSCREIRWRVPFLNHRVTGFRRMTGAHLHFWRLWRWPVPRRKCRGPQRSSMTVAATLEVSRAQLAQGGQRWCGCGDARFAGRRRARVAAIHAARLCGQRSSGALGGATLGAATTALAFAGRRFAIPSFISWSRRDTTVRAMSLHAFTQAWIFRRTWRRDVS